MFDFNDIHKESIERSILDIKMQDYLDHIAYSIIFGKKDKYPLAEELAGLPDYCWKPEKYILLRKMIAQLPPHLTNCNLNWVDVSELRGLNYLFLNSSFNGDISRWKVDNVRDMNYTFQNSWFNGDISQWNVSKVESMNFIFSGSYFGKDNDISAWVNNGYISLEQASTWGLLSYMHRLQIE